MLYELPCLSRMVVGEGGRASGLTLSPHMLTTKQGLQSDCKSDAFGLRGSVTYRQHSIGPRVDTYMR